MGCPTSFRHRIGVSKPLFDQPYDILKSSAKKASTSKDDHVDLQIHSYDFIPRESCFCSFIYKCSTEDEVVTFRRLPSLA